jgi:hypothetical protein
MVANARKPAMMRLGLILIFAVISPALADTAQNPPAAGSSLDEILKTIGLFIGTYGLAVFLVVYYAVRLYPEIQKERGEWIRQITILRQLIDPGNRSLTRDQANVVLQLVSSILVDRLKFGQGRIGFGPGEDDRAVQCSQLKHQLARALNPARAAAYLS